MSDLLLGRILSVRNCWFHKMVTLPSRLVATDFGTWSYRCLFYDFTPIYYYYYYYYLYAGYLQYIPERNNIAGVYGVTAVLYMVCTAVLYIVLQLFCI
jgi:hypothetical protein